MYVVHVLHGVDDLQDERLGLFDTELPPLDHIVQHTLHHNLIYSYPLVTQLHNDIYVVVVLEGVVELHDVLMVEGLVDVYLR